MSDLINRRAAIDALYEVSEHYTNKGREWHPHINFMVDAIKDLPSAEPEQKTGTWTFIEGKYGEDKYYCSHCGDWNSYGETDYCPYCGAKMR